MASNNKTLKFQGTKIKFYKRDTSTGTYSLKLKALDDNQAYIDSSDFKKGEVIYLISDHRNLFPEGFYMIDIKSNVTILLGLKLDGLGTDEEITDVSYQKVEPEGFCYSTSLNLTPMSISYTEVTTNCDDYPQEEGEVSAGEASSNIYWRPENELQKFLLDSMRTQEKYFMAFSPKDSNVLISFGVRTSEFSISGSVGDKYTGSIGWKLTSHVQQLSLSS